MSAIDRLVELLPSGFNEREYSPRGDLVEVMVVVVLLVVGAIAVKIVSNQARRKRLMTKYGDAHAVDMIMKRSIWQGMSSEQLVDSLGRPAATDRKVHKSKVVETYKYDQSGKNRFRNRVKLENGVVVGWDMK